MYITQIMRLFADFLIILKKCNIKYIQRIYFYFYVRHFLGGPVEQWVVLDRQAHPSLQAWLRLEAHSLRYM